MATVAQVAGTAFSVMGAMQAAEAGNKQADYNAAVARNNALLAEQQAADAQRRGELDAQNVRRKADMLRGTQRATMAARGLDLSYGSAQDIIDQTDYFGQVDQNTARYNADMESWAKNEQAKNFRTQAAAAQASKKDPLMAGLTTLAGSFITSASPVDTKWTGASGTGLKATSGWGGASVSNPGGLGLKWS